MKKLFVLSLAFCFFTVASQAQDSRALSILDAMSAKYQKIPAFKAKISSKLENKEEGIDEEFKGEITVQKEKYRLKMGGQEVFNNGENVWTFLKDDNEVTIMEYDESEEEMTPSKIYNAYKEGYKSIFLEEKTAKGVVYEIVDLIPDDKSSQFFKIRLEIAKADKTLKSWKMFDKNGNRYTYKITDFNPGVNVNDNYFNFDASNYADVEVVDLR